MKKPNDQQAKPVPETFLYQDDDSSQARRFKRMVTFNDGMDHDETLFDIETFCQGHPGLDEVGYAAYLLDLFKDQYFQDFCGTRGRPCKAAVDIQTLDAVIIGYDINAPIKRAIYRIGFVEEGIFALASGWARLTGPDHRIVVLPQPDMIMTKIKRAGFVTRNGANWSDRACFAVRGLGDHVIVLTYGAAIDEGYLERLQSTLAAGGLKSKIGFSKDCKLSKTTGTPDERMLVIGVQ